MEDTALVLLIVVSSALTVFLIVFIIALIYVIKILKSVKRVTEHAENVAESVESAAATFEKTASPLAILKLISNIVGGASGYRRKKGE